MFKPFCSHRRLLGGSFGRVLEGWHKFSRGFLQRDTHLWEHFGQTDKTALITCFKHINIWGTFLQVLDSSFCTGRGDPFMLVNQIFHRLSGPLRVLIVVEDVVENRGLYRFFVPRLVKRGFRHYSTTIAAVEPFKRFRTRRLSDPTFAWMRDRAR